MKKKILHVIESLGRGGAETLLVGVINELNDFEHHLLILNSPETLQEEIVAEHKYINLRISGWKQLLLKVRYVNSYIKKNKIDIVHSHLYRANILARLAAPGNVHLLNSIHTVSSLDNYQVRRLSLYLERLSYNKRVHIIAVSHTVLTDFDQWVKLKGPANVLYNYIDDRFFAHTHIKKAFSSRFKLVAVGNLRKQKNYSYLIESFKKLPAGISLDIYGEGGLRDEIQNEIDTHKLNIKLCGSHKNILTVLPGYDAFVMSSFFEGQPLALLEAMASGLPAFLSDIPVLREVAGENAVYFDVNDPNALICQLEKMILQPDQLADIAEKGAERVEKIARKKNYMSSLAHIYKNHLSID